MTETPPALLFAPCKINLVLRIEGRRDDGFHELDTLFYPLPDPHDVIHIEPAPAGSGMSLHCPGVDCPTEKNLLWKAWDGLARESGFRPDISVTVEQRIPSGAGLGGGSSDAAALLSWLNAQAGDKALPPERLAALALTLGADVPFFLRCRPARAKGVGEKLAPVDADLSGFTLLLLCPETHVNTAWAYKAWDETRLGLPSPGSLTRILTAPEEVDTGSLCPWPLCLENDFESAVFPAFPGLRRLKEEALRLGAAGVVMSGSGASIVAAFRDFDAAQGAATALRDGDATGGLKAYVLRP